MISPQHRRRLNRAMHELRRPLQALTLLDGERVSTEAHGPGPARRGLLELARSALAELDGEVNGSGAAPTPQPSPSPSATPTPTPTPMPTASPTPSPTP